MSNNTAALRKQLRRLAESMPDAVVNAAEAFDIMEES